ncbi:hypothetical protein AgCh_008838 [Apium graveolens]
MSDTQYLVEIQLSGFNKCEGIWCYSIGIRAMVIDFVDCLLGIDLMARGSTGEYNAINDHQQIVMDRATFMDMVQEVASRQQQNSRGNNNRQNQEGQSMFDRFMKQRPNCFKEAKTPMDAEAWMDHMEKIFRKGKLSPRYIGPFEILEKVGVVAYRVALPPQLSRVHNVFHASVLRKYVYHPYHIVQYPLDTFGEDLSCEEEAEAILAREERVMRKKTIPFVKVLWRNHDIREATWEMEDSVRSKYTYLFESGASAGFRGRNYFKGGRI